MAYSKVTHYGDSESILESEVGLVTKTCLATSDMASEVDGRKIVKAGTFYDDTRDAFKVVENPIADTYSEVEPADGDNPKAKGWFEESGGSYALTGDSEVNASKAYYAKVAGDTPSAEGWYEASGDERIPTQDASVVAGKSYYEKTATASGMLGVVFQDYDMTDYPERPVSLVVAGRLKSDKVSSEAVAAKESLADQGLYII